MNNVGKKIEAAKNWNFEGNDDFFDLIENDYNVIDTTCKNCIAGQRNSDLIDQIEEKICNLFISKAKDIFGTK